MQFSTDEEFALQLDREDPLREFRDRFELPRGADGKPLIYFCGNSLGLMPKTARGAVDHELDAWAKFAVEAHHGIDRPWYTYHEPLREPLARLVGARPHEVVCMNTLTVNLHLMLASFYRPTKTRFKIVMETPAFPSDVYAIKSQIAHYGFDPKDALLLVAAREGENTIRQEQFEAAIAEHGDSVAVIAVGALNFITGQFFDIQAISAAAREHGITVGVDLAHAIGNVPLAMHDWNVDFAVWCTYKYLNSGPGAVAGAFVHERHATNTKLPRLAGWFGNDPKTRFRLDSDFIPVPSADAWQVSNPPIFSMAPIRASLAIFDDAGGMKPLREKSVKLTAYLEFLLDEIGSERFTVITPREPSQRGCQLSIMAHENPKELLEKLQAAGVRCDFREPNVIRAAPTPLYNTFHEVWRFAQILSQHR